MVVMNGSVIAVLSILLASLSSFKASAAAANSIVANSIDERNSNSEPPRGVYAAAFTQREITPKPNEVLNKLSFRAAEGFAVSHVAPILPRATSTSTSTKLVTGTSPTPTAASFPSSSSSTPNNQCFCDESGCSPESPPCCANGSCAVSRVKNEAEPGIKIRLSMYIGLLSVVVAFLMS